MLKQQKYLISIRSREITLRTADTLEGKKKKQFIYLRNCCQVIMKNLTLRTSK